MSSKDRSSARRAVTSRYNASMTARRSPSSAISAPVVVLMVRMSDPEALDGGRLVRVDFDEGLGAGEVQHRFDALLHPGKLEVSAGAAHLTVEVHQTADRGAVDVGHRREVDQDLVPA